MSDEKITMPLKCSSKVREVDAYYHDEARVLTISIQNKKLITLNKFYAIDDYLLVFMENFTNDSSADKLKMKLIVVDINRGLECGPWNDQKAITEVVEKFNNKIRDEETSKDAMIDMLQKTIDGLQKNIKNIGIELQEAKNNF